MYANQPHQFNLTLIHLYTFHLTFSLPHTHILPHSIHLPILYPIHKHITLSSYISYPRCLFFLICILLSPALIHTPLLIRYLLILLRLVHNVVHLPAFVHIEIYCITQLSVCLSDYISHYILVYIYCLYPLYRNIYSSKHFFICFIFPSVPNITTNYITSPHKYIFQPTFQLQRYPQCYLIHHIVIQKISAISTAPPVTS